MIAVYEEESNIRSMNPIALIETAAAARSTVLGALATDPVPPRRRRLTGGDQRTGGRHDLRDERCEVLRARVGVQDAGA